MQQIRMLALSRFIFAFILCGAMSSAFAQNNPCWADVFDETQYTGKRLHIDGPSSLENLTNINGENWDQKIHSLQVGPKAQITIYKNPKFQLSLTEMANSPEQMRSLGVTVKDIKEDSELIFNENAKIHDLGDFNFHKQTRSLKIECK